MPTFPCLPIYVYIYICLCRRASAFTSMFHNCFRVGRGRDLEGEDYHACNLTPYNPTLQHVLCLCCCTLQTVTTPYGLVPLCLASLLCIYCSMQIFHFCRLCPVLCLMLPQTPFPLLTAVCTHCRLPQLPCHLAMLFYYLSLIPPNPPLSLDLLFGRQ